ncbi:hypothetical protein C8039_17780 [Halogeometricum sp. wsp3]|nr:hypothetical protein C8039_17780 [Halogeometricum sp. wsp3]
MTQRRENAAEWTDLRKRGTALLMLLNLQIGRPKYERIGQIRKPDRADKNHHQFWSVKHVYRQTAVDFAEVDLRCAENV